MYTTTVGKVLLKRIVPRDLQSYVETTTLDKKGISALCLQLAEKHKDQYSEIVTNLARLGFEIATRDGASITLNDLLCPINKEQYFKDAESKITDVKKKNLKKDVEDAQITKIYTDMTGEMEKEIVKEGIKQNKTLAKVVASGSRGSATQYLQTVVSPVIVSDASGKPKIDYPIKRSFAEGLTLPEYLMSSFGARSGLVSVKMSTADSGYSSKQMSRAAMTLGITEHDCGTHRGIPVHTNNRDYVGSYLAQPVDKYHYNNEITSTILHDLANKQIKEIIVRSPMTCEAAEHSGAICQLCAGKREHGLPDIGEYIGVTAASALGEPLSQGMLSHKHSGGAVKARIGEPENIMPAKPHISGFKLINQLLNIPENFVDKAPVVIHAGIVKSITPSPAGGWFVEIQDSE